MSNELEQELNAMKCMFMSAMVTSFFIDANHEMRDISGDNQGEWMKKRLKYIATTCLSGGSFYDADVDESTVDKIFAEYGIGTMQELVNESFGHLANGAG